MASMRGGDKEAPPQVLFSGWWGPMCRAAPFVPRLWAEACCCTAPLL